MEEKISLNFGAIKETIERLSKWEFMKESKEDTLKKFISKVKDSPLLIKQHLVFKNFTDCKPFETSILAERYIMQNLQIMRGSSWNKILTENKKVRIELLENHHVESTGAKNNELYDNVHAMIESVTNPLFKESEASQKAYSFLLEYLTRKAEANTSEEKTENPPFKNWKYITNLAVNNFNKRYSHLKEDEKNVLKMLLAEGDKKINYIEDLRQDSNKLIDKLMAENICKDKVKTLQEFKEKIKDAPNLTVENINDYLINYFELNKTLKELF